MKRKVLFLIVAIVGILATMNLNAASGSRGVCADSGWGCRVFCPVCGTWFKSASGRLGPGVLTYCAVCDNETPYVLLDGETEEELELE